jgi:hypothetical protein
VQSSPYVPFLEVVSHSSTLVSWRFAADILLLLVCRSFKDEYTAAIERQANNWRDLAAELSSQFEAVKSELDRAVKKNASELERHQRTSAEVRQLFSSARAKCFETSATDLECVLTNKQALLKESEQAQELLNYMFSWPVSSSLNLSFLFCCLILCLFTACLFVLCACCIYCGALHCMAHYASFSASSRADHCSCLQHHVTDFCCPPC